MNKICTNCGGTIEYDTTTMLMSDPPKYQGKCPDCKNVTYELCSNIDYKLKGDNKMNTKSKIELNTGNLDNYGVVFPFSPVSDVDHSVYGPLSIEWPGGHAIFWITPEVHVEISGELPEDSSILFNACRASLSPDGTTFFNDAIYVAIIDKFKSQIAERNIANLISQLCVLGDDAKTLAAEISSILTTEDGGK